jgi:DNA mismatch repair protein MutS
MTLCFKEGSQTKYFAVSSPIPEFPPVINTTLVLLEDFGLTRCSGSRPLRRGSEVKPSLRVGERKGSEETSKNENAKKTVAVRKTNPLTEKNLIFYSYETTQAWYSGSGALVASVEDQKLFFEEFHTWDRYIVMKYINFFLDQSRVSQDEFVLILPTILAENDFGIDSTMIVYSGAFQASLGSEIYNKINPKIHSALSENVLRCLAALKKNGASLLTKKLERFRLPEFAEISSESLTDLRIPELLDTIFDKHIRSKMGRATLKLWLELSLANSIEIEKRQNHVSKLMEVASTIDSLSELLSSSSIDVVKEYKNLIASFDFEGKAKVDRWKNVRDSLGKLSYVLESVKTIIDIDSRDAVTVLTKAVYWIEQVIDFEGSSKSAQLKVNIACDSSLAKLEIQQKKMQQKMEEAASHEEERLEKLRRSESDLVEVRIQFLPGTGFLLFVEPEKLSEEMIETLNWSFMFATEQAEFFKSKLTQFLFEEFGDLMAKIRAVEYDLLFSLCEQLKEIEEKVEEAVRLGGEIDVLMGFAKIASTRNWIKPHLNKSLNLVNFYNPLITEKCQPLSISVDPGKPLVLTGSNSSGKSVVLNSIALAVLLTQIGCFIPASYGTSIPVYSKLSYRSSPNDEENELSSFTADLAHLGNVLNQSEAGKALVIFDEFGRGTCLKDAVALTVALLNHFSRSQESSNQLIISTHFGTELGQLSQNDLEFCKVSWFMMKSILDEYQLRFFYEPHLAERDEISCMHAIEVAKIYGLPESVINQAKLNLLSAAAG